MVVPVIHGPFLQKHSFLMLGFFKGLKGEEFVGKREIVKVGRPFPQRGMLRETSFGVDNGVRKSRCQTRNKIKGYAIII